MTSAIVTITADDLRRNGGLAESLADKFAAAFPDGLTIGSADEARCITVRLGDFDLSVLAPALLGSEAWSAYRAASAPAAAAYDAALLAASNALAADLSVAFAVALYEQESTRD